MEKTTRTARRPRALSPLQREVLPLSPIFAACKSRGLSTSNETRERRLYAINRAFNDLPFDYIESLKDLLVSPAAIAVVASLIEGGFISW